MVANLAVHRNKIEARRKRNLAKSVKEDVAKLIRETDVRAYAFVSIDAEGKARCLWDTGAILPMWAFPATVSAALMRDLEESGLDEDWKPALTLRGSGI